MTDKIQSIAEVDDSLVLGPATLYETQLAEAQQDYDQAFNISLGHALTAENDENARMALQTEFESTLTPHGNGSDASQRYAQYKLEHPDEFAQLSTPRAELLEEFFRTPNSLLRENEAVETSIEQFNSQIKAEFSNQLGITERENPSMYGAEQRTIQLLQYLLDGAQNRIDAFNDPNWGEEIFRIEIRLLGSTGQLNQEGFRSLVKYTDIMYQKAREAHLETQSMEFLERLLRLEGNNLHRGYRQTSGYALHNR